jgi:hypothetical protein
MVGRSLLRRRLITGCAATQPYLEMFFDTNFTNFRQFNFTGDPVKARREMSEKKFIEFLRPRFQHKS